ncbi:MAG: hypothetical protein AAGA93_20770 [Actinomycetota bacterium]
MSNDNDKIARRVADELEAEAALGVPLYRTDDGAAAYTASEWTGDDGDPVTGLEVITLAPGNAKVVSRYPGVDPDWIR